MKRSDLIANKIIPRNDIKQRVEQWRFLSKTIAFTNGVFDIIHKGHIFSLSEAAKEADILIVGLNSDSSAKKLKGPARPVNNEQARAMVLASLVMVDAVVLFEEDTPLELVKTILPDVLVKGGDYSGEQVVGSKEVAAAGGRTVINPTLEGYSTTSIIEKFKK